eukprot:1156531-Pelagomonas_calceolata.AAC.5
MSVWYGWNADVSVQKHGQLQGVSRLGTKLGTHIALQLSVLHTCSADMGDCKQVAWVSKSKQQAWKQQANWYWRIAMQVCIARHCQTFAVKGKSKRRRAGVKGLNIDD